MLDRDDYRESVWSVLRGATKLYLTLFTVQVVTGGCLIIQNELQQVPPNPLDVMLLNIWNRTGNIVLASTAFGLIGTEVVRDIMVLTRGMYERIRKAQEARRREGREEAHRAWAEWLARREEALGRGQEFTEPAPNERETAQSA